MKTDKDKKYLTLFLLLLSPIFVWSILDAENTSLWISEILPLIVGLIVLIVSNKRYPLTAYSYTIIFIGATLMLVGSHYSYSKVPICEWIKTVFDLERNNYDKIVHFFQGFIMASLIKELIMRKNVSPSMRWTNFFSLTFAIAVGAIWEIIEWLFVIVAISFNIKKPASDYLGTQGYYWDAQSDMFFATVGALVALFLLGKYHEKSVRNVMEDH